MSFLFSRWHVLLDDDACVEILGGARYRARVFLAKVKHSVDSFCVERRKVPEEYRDEPDVM